MAELNLTSLDLVWAAVAGLIPALLWLWFWLKQDLNQPEPKRMILLVFAVGALMVFPAHWLITANFAVLENRLGYSLNFQDPALAALIPAAVLAIVFFIAALIEETLKLGVASLAFRSRFFDEPIDAMIYLITAALGFAAAENFFYFIDALWSTESTYLAFGHTSLRFLGATVVHVVSSAVLGTFIAFSWHQSIVKKAIALLVGLLTATILHAAFNFFIMQSADHEEAWRIFLSLWGGVIIIILLFEKVKRLNY